MTFQDLGNMVFCEVLAVKGTLDNTFFKDIDTIKSMEIVLRNYWVFMQHLESLAETNSQSLKWAELEGYTKKWMNAKYPIHLAIYLDILTPLKVLSLGFQK